MGERRIAHSPVARAGGAVLLAVAWLAGCGEAERPPVDRIVLVTIDTLRADHVGSYGDAGARTPTLDGVAAAGVRFDQAVSPVPLTLPSHTSMLTGLQPPHHGVRDNSTFRLDRDVPTVAEHLYARGFATAAFVSAIVLDAGTGLTRGFGLYDDHMSLTSSARFAGFAERPADATVSAALAWVATAPERFFLWVHLYDPHSAYRPPLGFKLAFPRDPYAGEIAFADAEVGRLLAGIRARYADDAGGGTLVVVTSDHGESLGEHGEATHGFTIYEATQRVPLLVSGPGFPAGRVATPVVRLVDIAPTVLAAAGAEPLPEIDGRDLRSAVRGQDREPRLGYVETLATQLAFGWSPLLGVRTDTHKWIRAPRPELYDLRADPKETSNVAESQGDTVAKLDGALDAILVRTRRAASGPLPDEEERAKLESLGYVVPAEMTDPETLGRVGGPDPKDRIGLLDTMDRVELLLTQGRGEEALTLLADVDDPGVFVDLARARAAALAGRGAEGEAHARSALAKAPHFIMVLMSLADTLVAQGKIEDARRVYEQAVALEPRNGTPVAGLGRLAEVEGRRAEAEVLYQRAVGAPAPGREAAWRLAALLMEDGDPVSADALLRRVDSDELRSKPVALRLADAEIRAGRREAALARLEAARLVAPGDPELARRVGILRLDAGQLAEAQTALEDALAKTPDGPSAKADLAYVLALRGQDLDRALALAQAAVAAARPGEAAALLDTLAAVHLARGDAAAALAAADRGLASRDAPPIARAPLLARRAAACAALGRRADARSALREAFAEDARAGNTAAGWKPMAETLARELGVTPPASAPSAADTSRG